jgi:hypothetical protein
MFGCVSNLYWSALVDSDLGSIFVTHDFLKVTFCRWLHRNSVGRRLEGGPSRSNFIRICRIIRKKKVCAWGKIFAEIFVNLIS